MKNKVLDNIIEFYANRTGINHSALSYQVWEIALADRMQKNALTNEWDYYQRWVNSPAEIQHFFERIVVLETWFFRDQAAYNYLASYAFNEWYPKKQDKQIMRLLSIPCSTGEEPYSMAIALIQAGFPSRMFSIDAIDICQTAIAKAELGIYGKNSFRGKEVPDFSHFFDTIEEGFKIKSTVHQQVNFRAANVFDYGFLSSKPKYDVIFCRNLLIYLHPEAQNQLLRLISGLLSSFGVVFCGPTEVELLRKYGFVPGPVPKAAAFYNAKVDTKAINTIKKHTHIEPKQLITVEPPKPLISQYLKAKEFADQGQFEEAISECLNVLQVNGPSAEGYYLLGVIMHASNRKERAEEFFKKALYLEPDYQEALVYMALIAEANGQFEESQRYRERLARMEDSGAGKA